MSFVGAPLRRCSVMWGWRRAGSRATGGSPLAFVPRPPAARGRRSPLRSFRDHHQRQARQQAFVETTTSAGRSRRSLSDPSGTAGPRCPGKLAGRHHAHRLVAFRVEGVAGGRGRFRRGQFLPAMECNCGASVPARCATGRPAAAARRLPCCRTAAAVRPAGSRWRSDAPARRSRARLCAGSRGRRARAGLRLRLFEFAPGASIRSRSACSASTALVSGSMLGSVIVWSVAGGRHRPDPGSAGLRIRIQGAAQRVGGGSPPGSPVVGHPGRPDHPSTPSMRPPAA